MKRFWVKVDKNGLIPKNCPELGNCWIWLASSRGNGYGCFKYNGKVYDTHRFVWFLTYGEFPKQWVLHKCSNRKCVNPNHLYEGTPTQNYWDMRNSGNAHVPERQFTKEQLLIKKRIWWKDYYQKLKQNPEKYKKWRATQKSNNKDLRK